MAREGALRSAGRAEPTSGTTQDRHQPISLRPEPRTSGLTEEVVAERIDLEQARKRAKELVRAGAQPRLAEAQLTIARELGFSSWPALVHHIEDERATRAERAARFVELATVGRLDARGRG